MPYIYKITNLINDKMYIGKTTNTIQYRFQQHWERRNIEKCPIHNAMIKYGKHNFTVEKVEECPLNILNDREKYWIKYYNTYNIGYNATMGGDGTQKYDYAEIFNLWNSGYKQKQIKNELNCSDWVVTSALNAYDVPLRDRRVRPKQIKIEQYNLNGQYINTFISLTEAAKLTNSNMGNISEVCKQKRFSANGFLWKYEYDPTNIKEWVNLYNNRMNSHAKSIIQYDLSNNFIKEYPSIKEASLETNANYTHIGEVCKGIRKSCGGYIWKYKGEKI